ncbi:hypothetical protein A6B43_00665 [Vespertiliibacter pulmonis]|uniref:Outer membrane protein n=1 Tax=Vespertiliibacter pulmonis TaxID=1443036 RepID=A0A3N4WLV9_9PAST|nr:hypothetical protein [Vespertiliibacter pulmonis]QLB20152.1 hypothetical protein A6B43_00665 [Vespertiliibacter pulmonis]RPE86124.1 hypothetical protein EDC46_0517 [Vespertiliibacter pulmonis]
MKFLHKIAVLVAISFGSLANVWAEDFNIKYNTNYLMPSYVHFKNDGKQYSIQSKINVPFYNIVFTAKGYEKDNQFHLLSYRDTRNGKNYALAEIDSKRIQYGKVKEPLKQETLVLPTFDLFSLAFQLSYYDKLPLNFQTTNGKKLYPAKNVVLNRTKKIVKLKGNSVEEVTYKFKTDNKNIIVKKWVGEKFPRYISYSRDGDNYELTFDEFVK